MILKITQLARTIPVIYLLKNQKQPLNFQTIANKKNEWLELHLHQENPSGSLTEVPVHQGKWADASDDEALRKSGKSGGDAWGCLGNVSLR